MYNKLILTDADGVLLDWEYAFNIWMNEKGYKLVSPLSYNVGKRYNITHEQGKDLIKYFNESASIGYLPPLRDAMHYVRKLHEECGYIFKVITSLSTHPHAVDLRKKNLNKLFGTAIDEVICLETGADKDEALAQYEGSGLLWVEDKYLNAEAGSLLGLNSIIVEHGHNMDYNSSIPLVKNWKEIYEIVRG